MKPARRNWSITSSWPYYPYRRFDQHAGVSIGYTKTPPKSPNCMWIYNMILNRNIMSHYFGDGVIINLKRIELCQSKTFARTNYNTNERDYSSALAMNLDRNLGPLLLQTGPDLCDQLRSRHSPPYLQGCLVN